MHWIVQNNLFNEHGHEKLLRALEAMEVPHTVVEVVPPMRVIEFAGALAPEPQVSGPAVAFGGYTLVRMAQARGWRPGVWQNESFDYRVWSEKWAGHVLNEPLWVGPFSDVPYQKKRHAFFIRPCADDKAFTGMVTDWYQFTKWSGEALSDPSHYRLGPGTPVVVSSAKTIEREYRFMVIGGRVVTGSSYKMGRTLWRTEPPPDGVEAFAQKIADIWCPADAFVLDVFLHEGNPYVGEMGCINAAGFYNCDMGKVVAAVEAL